MEHTKFEMTTMQLEASVNSIIQHCNMALALNPVGAAFVLQHALDFLQKQYGVTITSSDFIADKPYKKLSIVKSE